MDNATGLTPEERRRLKHALLGFVERVSRGGYEIPGEAFGVLPAVVDRLLEDDL